MHPDPNREAFLRMIESQPLLGGRFSDVNRLGPDGGTGQFSLMFRARDTTTKQVVALKMFHPARAGDAYRVESFRREEALLQRFLTQESIVQVVAPISGHHETVQTTTGMSIGFAFEYYALELARSDLGAHIAGSLLDPEEKLLAFREACRGIQRMHAHRIAHRDVKPANLLVMLDGTVRVSDLGTARDMRSTVPAVLQDYGMFWPGDRRYAAPEVLAGLFSESQEFAFGADFFALGATLFELFTGMGLFAYVFSPALVTDLTTVMHDVRPGRRKSTYDAFVSALEAGHPLPDLSDVNQDVPASVRDRLNELYRDLCRLDYRRRMMSFPVVFRRIQSCILCYRHEVKQRALTDRRRQRRSGRSETVEGVMRL